MKFLRFVWFLVSMYHEREKREIEQFRMKEI